jgi:hypothetical protein
MRDLEDEKRIKEYMAAKMKHIKMYDECMNLADGLDVAKFAELVRADEREKVAQWMIERSFATGHGDSIEDLLKEIEWQVAEREREACAKVCDGIMQYYKTNTTLNTDQNLIGYMAAELCGVRIRGKK